MTTATSDCRWPPIRFPFGQVPGKWHLPSNAVPSIIINGEPRR
jgi:hypothetical protein